MKVGQVLGDLWEGSRVDLGRSQRGWWLLLIPTDSAPSPAAASPAAPSAAAALAETSLPSLLPSTEELLGMSPLPCAKVHLPEAAENESAPAALEGSHPTAPKRPSEEGWAVLPPEPAPAEGSPSESSESVSLVTQIANPASVPAAQLQTGAQPAGTRDLCQRLLEATSEEQSSLPKPSELGHPSAPARQSAESSEPVAVTELRGVESRAQGRTETLKEEGPTDLRVFELNSDSGKSTPSNNGKKGGCGASTRPGSLLLGMAGVGVGPEFVRMEEEKKDLPKSSRKTGSQGCLMAKARVEAKPYAAGLSWGCHLRWGQSALNRLMPGLAVA